MDLYYLAAIRSMLAATAADEKLLLYATNAKNGLDSRERGA